MKSEADTRTEIGTKGDVDKLQNFCFELHGSQFENRATDRATKKFKQKNLSDL